MGAALIMAFLFGLEPQLYPSFLLGGGRLDQLVLRVGRSRCPMGTYWIGHNLGNGRNSLRYRELCRVYTAITISPGRDLNLDRCTPVLINLTYEGNTQI